MDINWRKWTRENWNVLVFNHFFNDTKNEDRPVYRIPVTEKELKKIVSDSDAKAKEVQEAFLSAMRTPSHIEYNQRLKSYVIDAKKGWGKGGVPPFFIELAFSCLVASPPDGVIRDIGDFRNRLALLLNHDISTSNYPLDILPKLWRAFDRWIFWRRATGDTYRRLELPPLDHRKRIGYSIKLAFPPRKDFIKLTELFAKSKILPPLTIPDVFHVVGKKIDKFSKEFQKAYDEFRNAFSSKETNLEKYSFWDAIIAAAESVEKEKYDESNEENTRRLKLIMEPNGYVLLLGTVTGALGSDGGYFVEADTPFRNFGCVFCDKKNSDNPFYRASLKLLDGHYRGEKGGTGWQNIDSAINQGILLFYQTETLSWELAFTRSEGSEYRALIRNDLLDTFLFALPLDQRPYCEESKYRHWKQLSFHDLLLDSLAYPKRCQLAKIRCLQPTITGPRIRLIGGCRVESGYLGIPGFLPIVRAPNLDFVEVLIHAGAESEEPDERIRLTKVEKDSYDFEFPKHLKKPLEGRHCIFGIGNDRILAQKNIVFRSEIVENSYKEPNDPDAWEAEAGGPATVTYGNNSSETKWGKRENGRRTGDPIADRSTSLFRKRNDRLSALCLKKSELRAVDSFEFLRDQNEIEEIEPAEAYRLLEICGALATNRKGIPESDMLSIIEKCLSKDSYELKWDILRGLMEAGHIDWLNYKKWNRIAYYPISPRFVILNRDGWIRGVLTGMATAAFRKRAGLMLAEMGAKKEKVSQNSNWIAIPPAWTSPSVTPYEHVSEALGLRKPEWLKPITEILWSLSEICSTTNIPPKHYEQWGCWDWNRGGFFRDTNPIARGVEIIRFHRPDRPTHYRVTIDGECVWWSTSRNWSLLMAYELNGEKPFGLEGPDKIVRISKGQVYLPIPLGRHLTIMGYTPGPSSRRCDRGAYFYCFRDSKEREDILSLIWGENGANVTEIRRWARWILTMARSSIEGGERLLSIPGIVRYELEQYGQIPEFSEIAKLKISPSLLNRVRKGLDRLKKSGEV